MPLSPSVIHELTAEVEALERKKQDIDERINAIMLILRKTPPQRRQPADEPIHAINGSVGLRGALRVVLARGALFPGEVIQSLRDTGFKVTGKTSIEMRVYNELARLKKDGLARKDSEGRYALAS